VKAAELLTQSFIQRGEEEHGKRFKRRDYRVKITDEKRIFLSDRQRQGKRLRLGIRSPTPFLPLLLGKLLMMTDDEEIVVGRKGG
jgi:hypothetical protein